jgi:palmitoyltransferase
MDALFPVRCAVVLTLISFLPVDYLYDRKRKHGVATALMVLYFLFLVLTLAPYVRTFIASHIKPALVPKSEMREEADRKRAEKGEPDDPEAQARWYPPENGPNTPAGLEAFYSKQVFACEADGKPRWCSVCWHWKPDRSHHSSELNRCVRKMDHLCPWVGGMVSESAFNFFVQFTAYCTVYCIICLSTAAYSLRLQILDGTGVDGRVVAVIALAGLFGIFTFTMTGTSGKYVFENITNIDAFRSSPTYTLAVRVPRGTPSTEKYRTITFPLPTYEDPTLTPDANGRWPTPTQRDDQAISTFAIVRGEPGENPWDLGYWRNFKSVMGNNAWSWLLPITESPCCNHESMVSDYELGPLVDELRKRYGLPDVTDGANGGIAMNDVRWG